MSYFINKNSNTLFSIPSGFSIAPKIPKKNWMIKWDGDKSSYYLEKLDPFTLPSKIYGDLSSRANRILNTFNQEDKNVGVLLKGLKGTGKSLLAKKICMTSNLPVLVLASPFHGPEFLSFLSSIKEEVVIFIDEFEKVYFRDYDNDRSKQEDLLSFLEGSISGVKKLFLLTANDGDIHDALLNRPGRVRYCYEYGGLESDVINEVIEDNLQEAKYKDEITRLLNIVGDINMDLLITFIKEVNLYSSESSIVEIANSLNIEPEGKCYICEWEVTKGVSMSGGNKKVKTATIFYNPLTRKTVYLSPEGGSKHNPSDEDVTIPLSDAKVVFKGAFIIITYKGIDYKFRPHKQFAFKFI